MISLLLLRNYMSTVVAIKMKENIVENKKNEVNIEHCVLHLMFLLFIAIPSIIYRCF